MPRVQTLAVLWENQTHHPTSVFIVNRRRVCTHDQEDCLDSGGTLFMKSELLLS